MSEEVGTATLKVILPDGFVKVVHQWVGVKKVYPPAICNVEPNISLVVHESGKQESVVFLAPGMILSYELPEKQ